MNKPLIPISAAKTCTKERTFMKQDIPRKVRIAQTINRSYKPQVRLEKERAWILIYREEVQHNSFIEAKLEIINNIVAPKTEPR